MESEIELFKSYMRMSKKKNGDGFTEKYIGDLSFYIEKLLSFNKIDNKKSPKITIEKFNDFLLKRKLHPNTVRGLFNYLKWVGYTKKDLFDVVIPPKKRARRIHEEKILTSEEMTRLLQESKNNTFKLILRIGWDTAARVSEIINLNIEDIIDNKVILRRTKGGYSDTRFLSDKTMKDTHDYIGKNNIKGGALFTKKGERLNKNQVRYMIQKNVMEILGKHFTTHFVRTSSAQNFFDNGGDVEALKAHGGWKSNAYQSYVRTNVKIKKKNFQKFHTEI